MEAISRGYVAPRNGLEPFGGGMTHPEASEALKDDIVWTILKLQDNAAKRGALGLWTVYDRPKDYPHGICARRHEVTAGRSKPTEHILIGELKQLQGYFRAAGLHRLPRDEKDDVKIVETWV